MPRSGLLLPVINKFHRGPKLLNVYSNYNKRIGERQSHFQLRSQVPEITIAKYFLRQHWLQCFKKAYHTFPKHTWKRINKSKLYVKYAHQRVSKYKVLSYLHFFMNRFWFHGNSARLSLPELSSFRSFFHRIYLYCKGVFFLKKGNTKYE